MLQTKRAVAAARAGQFQRFDTLRKLVHDRYGDQTIAIGGRDVSAAQFLDDLPQSLAPASSPSAATDLVCSSIVADAGPSLLGPIPEKTAPLWQLSVFEPELAKRISSTGARMGWSEMLGGFFLSNNLTAAFDDRRVYGCWMGICFAADPNTGKMIWRNGSIVDLPARLEESINQGALLGAPALLSVHGERLFYTTESASRGEAVRRLACLAADSGRLLWDSRKLTAWNFLGKPIFNDDALYICAHGSTAAELSLLCLGLADGELRWSIRLGTAAAASDYRGRPALRTPAFLIQANELYALTNDGAVLAVDLLRRQIDWAFTFPSTCQPNQQVFLPDSLGEMPMPMGALLVQGSTLLFKETAGNRLYAMELPGPALKWERPVESSVTLAAADSRHIYLVGDEADCIGTENLELLWSTRLSASSDRIGPLIAGHHMYVFGRRGVHDVGLDDGVSRGVFHGSDQTGGGAMLWRCGDKLITVSGTAITAYPLSASP